MILNIVEISSWVSLKVPASFEHDPNLPVWNMPGIHMISH